MTTLHALLCETHRNVPGQVLCSGYVTFGEGAESNLV